MFLGATKETLFIQYYKWEISILMGIFLGSNLELWGFLSLL